jgi:dTDP-4-dehydrorhamnose 3,5-epimerase
MPARAPDASGASIVAALATPLLSGWAHNHGLARQTTMIFRETEIRGAYIIAPELRQDERGFFARTFCQQEFAAQGLQPTIAQLSIVLNHAKGTIRGIHFQYPPAAEAKVVRCTRGAVLDVIVDLRPESATFLRHMTVEISARNRLALYVPERVAQGYQTLVDDTELLYAISEFYTPDLADGLRYDDPALGVSWPLPAAMVSTRDCAWPLFDDIGTDVRRRMTVPSAQTEDGRITHD